MKIKVNRLKTGDTIGFICPSSKYDMNSPRLKRLEEELEKLGLKAKYSITCKDKYGYLAGTDEVRKQDIEDMFLDKEVKAIMCMKGGYGASRIVDKIDYNIIEKNPKLFMGFSDITVLLNNIYQKTSIPTIHGLVGIFLGHPDIDEFSLLDFKKLIFENTKDRILVSPNDMAKTLVGGIAEGELVGGNLTLLANLTGTPYAVDFKDKIVFIEDVDEEPYSLDRMFSQLRLSGKLNEAKGIVLGHFTNCKGDEDSFTYEEVIEQYFKDFKIPVVTHFASGHEFPFINLPIGVKVRLDADKKEIKILEEIYNEES